MVFHTLNEIEKKARQLKYPKTVVVARAENDHVIEAVLKARKDGFIKPYLVGHKDILKTMVEKNGGNLEDEFFVNVDSDSPADVVGKSVDLINEGRGDVLMKGLLNTSDVLRGILNKEHGLKHEKLITQFSFARIPGYHKLVILNDAAITPYPTLEQRAAAVRLIAKNLRAMGYDETIRVAALCASENLNPKIIESKEAAELKKMCLDGQFPGIYIEGPISLDIALQPEVASLKKFDSPVAGNADVLLFPNMVSGNLMSKTLTCFAGGYSVGVVIGAQVPVSLTSRAATAKAKYTSLAVACLLAGKAENLCQ